MPPISKDPRPFQRAVLKLSGEALREPGSTDNISPEIVQRIASEIKEAVDAGLELAIVVGGGNFWRGAAASARGMDRATADYVGMLATVMNALAMEGALSHIGVNCTVMSAIEMKNVAEPFIRRKAEHQLDKGTVIIFAAEAGNEALDGLFTPVFAKALSENRDKSLNQIMQKVRSEVFNRSNGTQTPGEYNQLFDDVYLYKVN